MRRTPSELKGNVNPAAVWQPEFSGLKEHTVNITLPLSMRDRIKSGWAYCMNRAVIEEHFEGCHTYLSTRELTVKIHGLDCGEYSTDKNAGPNTKACPNGCVERIAKCLADLVEIKD